MDQVAGNPPRTGTAGLRTRVHMGTGLRTWVQLSTAGLRTRVQMGTAGLRTRVQLDTAGLRTQALSAAR